MRLTHFRGVPDKRAARFGLIGDHAVDFKLGANINTAHGIVHQDDAGFGAECPGEKRLLLVAAGQRQDIVVHVRRADAHPAFPVTGKPGFAVTGNEAALQEGAQ